MKFQFGFFFISLAANVWRYLRISAWGLVPSECPVSSRAASVRALTREGISPGAMRTSPGRWFMLGLCIIEMNEPSLGSLCSYRTTEWSAVKVMLFEFRLNLIKTLTPYPAIKVSNYLAVFTCLNKIAVEMTTTLTAR